MNTSNVLRSFLAASLLAACAPEAPLRNFLPRPDGKLAVGVDSFKDAGLTLTEALRRTLNASPALAVYPAQLRESDAVQLQAALRPAMRPEMASETTTAVRSAVTAAANRAVRIASLKAARVRATARATPPPPARATAR